jgi:hypothetical protein
MSVEIARPPISPVEKAYVARESVLHPLAAVRPHDPSEPDLANTITALERRLDVLALVAAVAQEFLNGFGFN